MVQADTAPEQHTLNDDEPDTEIEGNKELVCQDDELSQTCDDRESQDGTAASDDRVDEYATSLGDENLVEQSTMEVFPPDPQIHDQHTEGSSSEGADMVNSSQLKPLDNSLLVDQSLIDISLTSASGASLPPAEISPIDPPVLEVIEEESSTQLEIGDHVYQWCSLLGLPMVFQHHGIVMDIQRKPKEPSGSDSDDKQIQVDKKEDDNFTMELTIADFSNVHSSQKANGQSSVGLTQQGILRTYTDCNKWHKVQYNSPWWKQSVRRAGTCTSASPDAVGMVLARVNYILQHPDVLPDYHVLNANCECVAFWCKTGQWGTLQAATFLEATVAGQVKSSATLAATAATTQVTVQSPAAGLWGWLGYTTSSQVSWLSLHPAVVPALASYAAVSIGVPAIMYAQARSKWKETTERLQESFWESAMDDPEVFAECLTHWSDKR